MRPESHVTTATTTSAESCGDNVVVISTPEQPCSLKERIVATSLIGIRNATLTANSPSQLSILPVR